MLCLDEFYNLNKLSMKTTWNEPANLYTLRYARLRPWYIGYKE
jgi:hypothetical protein